MNDLVEYIKSKCKNLDDVYFRKMNIKNNDLWIIFNDALVASDLVSNFVIRSIVETITDYEGDSQGSKSDSNESNKLKDRIQEKLNIEKSKTNSKIELENSLAINKIKKVDKTEKHYKTYNKSNRNCCIRTNNRRLFYKIFKILF